MKVIFAFLFVAMMAVGVSFGEEAPPAFEKSKLDNEKPVAEEELDLFDPAISAPKNIRVQMEYIDLTQKDLTRLMIQDKSTTTDSKALRMKVQELVDKGEAKFIDTQMVISRSGQKSMTESHLEMIYPMEFDSSPTPVQDDSTKPLKEPITPFGIPSSYETRNVGSSFEVEPTMGVDHKIIDVRILTRYLWHTGNMIWYDAKDKLGNVIKAEMPNFYLISVDTSMTVISGQYFLAAILSPKDANGHVDHERKVVTFLKCDVLSAVP